VKKNVETNKEPIKEKLSLQKKLAASNIRIREVVIRIRAK
jgi:hypothetical protein